MCFAPKHRQVLGAKHVSYPEQKVFNPILFTIGGFRLLLGIVNTVFIVYTFHNKHVPLATMPLSIVNTVFIVYTFHNKHAPLVTMPLSNHHHLHVSQQARHLDVAVLVLAFLIHICYI